MTNPLTIGPATLYQGDCLEILPELPMVDMVVADPPYSSGGLMRSDRAYASGEKYTHKRYHNFCGDNRDQRSMTIWCAWWLGCLAKKLASGGALLCFIDWRNLAVITDAVQVAGLVLRGIVPWNKGPAARPNRGFFRSQCEYIVYATKGSLRSDAIVDGFFSCPMEGNKVHPTQKPERLLTEIIRILPDGSILDPFMGSGTTGVACVKAGRKFIGIEMDQYWFDVACKRIENAAREISLLRMSEEEAPCHT